MAERNTKSTISIADSRPPGTPNVCMAPSAKEESHSCRTGQQKAQSSVLEESWCPVMGTEGTQAEKGLKASK